MNCKIIGINLTTSMPIGLYIRLKKHAPQRGDIVAVCLPPTMSVEGIRRGYLMPGRCAFHSTPVLKKIIAVPHDTVRLTTQFIQVNQQRYFAPQQSVDPQGHRIRHFVNNKTYVHIQTFWLYGEQAPITSWDSRYFGGVSPKNILGVYRPWVIF